MNENQSTQQATTGGSHDHAQPNLGTPAAAANSARPQGDFIQAIQEHPVVIVRDGEVIAAIRGTVQEPALQKPNEQSAPPAGAGVASSAASLGPQGTAAAAGEPFLRPIETAPRDGTFVLLAGPSGYRSTPLRFEACKYDAEFRSRQPWVNHAGDLFLDGGLEPTHWMPLPKP